VKIKLLVLLIVMLVSFLIAGCAGTAKVSEDWYGVGATQNVTFNSRGKQKMVPFYAWYNPKYDLVLFQVGFYRHDGKSAGGQFDLYPMVKRSIYVLDPQTHIGAVVSVDGPNNLMVKDGAAWNGYIVPEDEKIKDFFPDLLKGQNALNEYFSTMERVVINKHKIPVQAAMQSRVSKTSFFNFGEKYGEKGHFSDRSTLGEFNKDLANLLRSFQTELKKYPQWKSTEVQGSTAEQKRFRGEALDTWFKHRAYCPQPGWLPYCERSGRLNSTALNKKVTADELELYQAQCKESAFWVNEWSLCDGGRWGAGNYYTASQPLPELDAVARKSLKGKGELKDLMDFLVGLRGDGK
jgi:hypothetical protein